MASADARLQLKHLVALGSHGGSPSREPGNALRRHKNREGEAPAEPAEALWLPPMRGFSSSTLWHSARTGARPPGNPAIRFDPTKIGRAKLLLSRRKPFGVRRWRGFIPTTLRPTVHCAFEPFFRPFARAKLFRCASLSASPFWSVKRGSTKRLATRRGVPAARDRLRGRGWFMKGLEDQPAWVGQSWRHGTRSVSK